MTYFDKEKDSGASARCGISAPGADVNKTSKMSLRSILLVGLGVGKGKIKVEEVSRPVFNLSFEALAKVLKLKCSRKL